MHPSKTNNSILDNNQIETIPPKFPPRFRYLDLSGNKISNAADLSNTSIHILDLSCNQISNFPPNYMPNKVKVISLSNNQLKAFPSPSESIPNTMSGLLLDSNQIPVENYNYLGAEFYVSMRNNSDNSGNVLLINRKPPYKLVDFSYQCLSTFQLLTDIPIEVDPSALNYQHCVCTVNHWGDPSQECANCAERYGVERVICEGGNKLVLKKNFFPIFSDNDSLKGVLQCNLFGNKSSACNPLGNAVVTYNSSLVENLCISGFSFHLTFRNINPKKKKRCIH